MTNEIALIVQNLSGLRIRDYAGAGIKNRLSDMIHRLFGFAGQSVEPEELANRVSVIVSEIHKDLVMKYRNLTLDEVEYALTAGVKGEYGEYFGINVVSISNWLRVYYNSEERREAQRSKVFPELLLPEKTEPTEAEKLAMIKNASIEAYKQAKDGKYIHDRGNGIYDYLVKIGKIRFTEAEMHVFADTAKRELEVEARERARDLRSPRPVSFYLEQITGKGIEARAKRIALNAFFKRVVESEKLKKQ